MPEGIALPRLGPMLSRCETLCDRLPVSLAFLPLGRGAHVSEN